MPKLKTRSSQVSEWVKNCCEIGDMEWYEASSDLMESFQKYAGCQANPKMMGMVLRDLGCKPRNYGAAGGRSWVGVKITTKP